MSSKIKTINLILYIIPLLLTVVSITVLYSLVFGGQDANLPLKQGIFSIVGILAMLIASFVDYRFFKGTSWILYIITLLLLVYVDFFGVAAGGAMRWIPLGMFQLQPSEVAKATTILALASFFSGKIGRLQWKDIIVSALIVSLPLLLILKEPDLGTALVISFIYIMMLFWSKPTKVQTITISAAILIMAIVLVLSAMKVGPFGSLLQDYQRNRILTFIDPNLDPYGKGYNVKQAQITIGSGGLFGRGLGRGSQSQLQFLPKPQTDFIFAGIAESFGFIGTAVFLSLFAYLIIQIVNVAHLARDNFGMLLAIGAASMFLFQVLVNVGMNLGLAPVTGIPLPFSSYGGSALVVYFSIIGVVQGVYMRHKQITF